MFDGANFLIDTGASQTCIPATIAVQLYDNLSDIFKSWPRENAAKCAGTDIHTLQTKFASEQGIPIVRLRTVRMRFLFFVLICQEKRQVEYWFARLVKCYSGFAANRREH